MLGAAAPSRLASGEASSEARPPPGRTVAGGDDLWPRLLLVPVSACAPGTYQSVST